MFQYTNRHGDLSDATDWKPHDSWDRHYTNVTGFEDRDQELENYLNQSAWTAWDSHVDCGASGANITALGLWQRDGSYINLEIGVTFTGAATAGGMTLDLPVPAKAMPNLSNETVDYGAAVAVSQGVAHGPRGMVGGNSGSPSLAAIYDASTVVGIAQWTNTFPWTWKNTDAISLVIRYRWA